MSDVPIPATWDRAGLESAGLRGFVPLIGLDRALLPPRRGVYVVLRDSGTDPLFLPENPVIRPKKYSVADLSAKWVVDASVVYIGKAEPRNGILGRLGAFSRQAANHSGGRALWQLADANELIVAWVETPDHAAHSVETSFLRAFAAQHGRLPYANWRF
jgi:hypothetical protein